MVEMFLSRYKPIENPIKGGQGEVIVCKDEHLDRKVAIKFILSDRDKRRLLDEIKALQKIRSKHVVEIFDILITEEPRRIGIIQEFVPGKDLVEIIASEKLSKADYLKLMYQIASGLADIHEQGIVHRDIKLNNIKIDEENIVKIFDFGLARILDSNTTTLGFVGTQLFAAPELYSHGIVSFTEAVDVYAFGVTAWLLSGEDPPDILTKFPPIGRDPSLCFSNLPYDLENEIYQALNLTVSNVPDNRPKMSSIKNLLGKHLLRGKHKATVVNGNSIYELTGANRSVILTSNSNSIGIKYNELDFIVFGIKGSVYINNQIINEGYILPNNCVVTLGERHLPRSFITFDISNPEVVL